MSCHSEIHPAISTFCLLLLRPQAHCLPPLDVIEYLSHQPLQVHEVPVISPHPSPQALIIISPLALHVHLACSWTTPLGQKTVTYSMDQHMFAINTSLDHMFTKLFVWHCLFHSSTWNSTFLSVFLLTLSPILIWSSMTSSIPVICTAISIFSKRAPYYIRMKPTMKSIPSVSPLWAHSPCQFVNLGLHHPRDCAILGHVLHHEHLAVQLVLQLPLLSPDPLPDIEGWLQDPTISIVIVLRVSFCQNIGTCSLNLLALSTSTPMNMPCATCHKGIGWRHLS